ncbi:MAG: hypothetical protein F6K19_39360 [Cyanothece sp. SIO1E1]|nr:hypothetical protein [Cyanothece sp. SIO1E1]
MEKIVCPQCLPSPGKPSPMSWALVPEIIKDALAAQGCSFLHHWQRKPHHLYVRFQYAPLVFQGHLFYLQRWAPAEWGVSPSQIVFPRSGWICTEETLSHGSLLSQVVRDAVIQMYKPNAARPKQFVRGKPVHTSDQALRDALANRLKKRAKTSAVKQAQRCQC